MASLEGHLKAALGQRTSAEAFEAARKAIGNLAEGEKPPIGVGAVSVTEP